MTKKKPKGREFEGRSAEMKDSCWLASEDLMDLGDVQVTIEKCYRYDNVEFDAGRKKEHAYALKFKDHVKELVLNSTNRKRLVAKFGTNVQDWKEKTITLYVDPNVKLKGETVCGIRIR